MKRERYLVYFDLEPNMKKLKIRRRMAYSTVCCIFLILCAVREVAGTERGEFLARMFAVKINPDDIEAHQFLAEWYIEKGDYTKAAKEIEIIVRLNPDLDLGNVIDVWGKLPEAACLAIKENMGSFEKPN